MDTDGSYLPSQSGHYFDDGQHLWRNWSQVAFNALSIINNHFHFVKQMNI
jgi:hypothetical protein